MDSFLKNRPVVELNAEGEAVLLAVSPEGSLGSKHADPSAVVHLEAGQERVELVRDEQGRIAHILVTCSCGQVLQLACDYA